MMCFISYFLFFNRKNLRALGAEPPAVGDLLRNAALLDSRTHKILSACFIRTSLSTINLWHWY